MFILSEILWTFHGLLSQNIPFHTSQRKITPHTVYHANFYIKTALNSYCVGVAN